MGHGGANPVTASPLQRCSIATLLLTGIANLHFRGWLAWDGVLGTAAFWRTPGGLALGIKLLAVVVLVTVSAIHDFGVGPAASRVSAGTPEALALRRRAALLGRLNAMVGLLLVVAAVRLART